MKKIITILASIYFVHNVYAQNANGNAQWRINGNSASTSDFIGTTNNQPLILKTNNIQRAIFDTQGKTIFDGGGEVVIYPGGLTRPILSNPIAAYMLKVGGSGHFEGELNSKQLFVQEYITYMKSLKGPRMDVDTIRMDSTRGIFGHTKIFGDVQIKQNLEVLGKTTLKGDLIAEKGFTFDGINGLLRTPETSTSGEIIQLGNIRNTVPRFNCPSPSSEPWNNFYYNGNFISYVPAGSIATHPLVNASIRIGMATWNGNGLIDVSGVDNNGAGNNALEINNFCKRNTLINTGWDYDPTHFVHGGRVIMGGEVEMQRSLKIGWNDSPIIDSKTAIEINQSVDNGNGIKINTYNNGLKCLTVNNTNFANSPFTVYGDGNTVINAGYPTLKYFKINDASDRVPRESFIVYGNGRTEIHLKESVSTSNAFEVYDDNTNTVNFKVKQNGYVYAREINVMPIQVIFPDYVFEKDYKLLALNEVENYIKENKHLPNIPSAKEVETHGINIAEMQVKQMEKIEELFLHLIKLKKENEELKSRLEILETK